MSNLPHRAGRPAREETTLRREGDADFSPLELFRKTFPFQQLIETVASSGSSPDEHWPEIASIHGLNVKYNRMVYLSGLDWARAAHATRAELLRDTSEASAGAGSGSGRQVGAEGNRGGKERTASRTGNESEGKTVASNKTT